MEVLSPKPRRQFRGKSVILEHLKNQPSTGLSIEAYCAGQGIASGSFHNWKKRYGQQENTGAGGFTSVAVSTSSIAVLFAEVKGIKIYQPVSADYLKELAS